MAVQKSFLRGWWQQNASACGVGGSPWHSHNKPTMVLARAVGDEELLPVDPGEFAAPVGAFLTPPRSPGWLCPRSIAGLGAGSGRKLWLGFDGTVKGWGLIRGWELIMWQVQTGWLHSSRLLMLLGSAGPPRPVWCRPPSAHGARRDHQCSLPFLFCCGCWCSQLKLHSFCIILICFPGFSTAFYCFK